MGITNLRLYDATRHSVASQLLNSGTTIPTISKILGHSSTKMTERYAHPDLESIRADLGKLNLKGKVVEVCTGFALEKNP